MHKRFLPPPDIPSQRCNKRYGVHVGRKDACCASTCREESRCATTLPYCEAYMSVLCFVFCFLKMMLIAHALT